MLCQVHPSLYHSLRGDVHGSSFDFLCTSCLLDLANHGLLDFNHKTQRRCWILKLILDIDGKTFEVKNKHVDVLILGIDGLGIDGRTFQV
ncbi:hypothetical protein VNO77_43479 [Canavalia gladiata]|uniref:Uncharacterized protein n=1 Tax=Canavalia gladiata TaxID=3824 RepID=A0AAN9JUU9_CANGL